MIAFVILEFCIASFTLFGQELPNSVDVLSPEKSSRPNSLETEDGFFLEDQQLLDEDASSIDPTDTAESQPEPQPPRPTDSKSPQLSSKNSQAPENPEPTPPILDPLLSDRKQQPIEPQVGDAAEARGDQAPTVSETRDADLQSPKQFDLQQAEDRPIKVEHPKAAKGLMRITSDGTYLYKPETSPITSAFAFRLGIFNPTELSNSTTGLVFNDIYDNPNIPIVHLEWGWPVWTGFLGRITLQLGSGVLFTDGKGRFKNDPALESRENFTFVAIPNTLGVSYRLQFSERQIIVPYAEGGGDAFVLAEFRDDGDQQNFAPAFGAHVSGGLGLNLGGISPLALAGLDSEFGINSVFFVLEYRRIFGFDAELDISGQYVTGGLLMDY